MANLRRIIREEIGRLLNEAYYGDLYHSTTLSHLYNMLDMDTLYSVPTPGSDSRFADRFPYEGEADAICMSRSRDSIYEKSVNNAVLTLDGWRLSTSLRNARIHPYDYQEGRDGMKSGEMEERLYFADIYPLSRYCKRIDIYVEDIDKDDYSSYCDDAEIAWKSLEDKGIEEPKDRDVNEWFLEHIVEDFPEWKDKINIHYVGGVNESIIFESADELDRISNELESFNKRMAEKYGTWMWFSKPIMKHHPDVHVSEEDLETRKRLYAAYKELKDKEDLEKKGQESQEDTEAMRWYRESQNLMSLAVEEYGTTGDIFEAGFILPDGTLLNFGGHGVRDTDHRNISGIYIDNDIPIWDDSYRFNYVSDFVAHGAVRCDASAGLLETAVEPTTEQYNRIKELVRMRNGSIEMDFSGPHGETRHSVYYRNPSPQQVEMDIYRFYNEGIKP